MKTTVCIATEDCYNSNNGAYTIFWFFDGEKVFTKGGMYSDLSFNTYSVDATEEQIIAASTVYMEKVEETYNYNKYANNGSGTNTYIGCIVSLSRSRKAPNNIPLKVIDFSDRYYNPTFRNWVGEKVDLVNEETGEKFTDISIGCIKEVIKGIKEKPFWFKSKK